MVVVGSNNVKYLKPRYASFARVPWEYLYAGDLVVIDESLKECVWRLSTWKAAIEEKGLTVKCSTDSKCRKDKDHDLSSMGWTSCRVQASFHAHWSGQQQHLLKWLQALGEQEMQWAQSLDKGP